MGDRPVTDAVDQRVDHDRPARRSWGSTVRPSSADAGSDADIAAIAADTTMRQFLDINRSMAALRRDLESGLSRLRRTMHLACWVMVALVALASAIVVALSRAEGGRASAASPAHERIQD
jgi:hypothetical protein